MISECYNHHYPLKKKKKKKEWDMTKLSVLSVFEVYFVFEDSKGEFQ